MNWKLSGKVALGLGVLATLIIILLYALLPRPEAQPPVSVPQIPDAPPPVYDIKGTEDKSDKIRVSNVKSGDIVASPLTVEGEARGFWYFEASFPVILEDGNGKVLGQVPAQAEGEWMTEAFVPFKATLDFDAPTSPTGTLILKKDNPSGLPEHDDEMRVLVRFKTP